MARTTQISTTSLKMSKQVNIPTQLRKLVDNQETLMVNGNTILEVIIEMESKYPGVKERVAAKGKINPFVLFFVNDEDIRFLDNEKTVLKDGDTISIVPAIAGG